MFSQNKTTDEDQPVVVEEEDEVDPTLPPPCKKNCALLDLFGETFSHPKRQDSHTTSTIDLAISELRAYREAEPLKLSDNPLVWWKKHQDVFPLLSNLARNTLCIPGTSVAAERVFSTAGDIVTAQRSVLKPEHVDQLLFLHKNVPRSQKR